MWKTVQASGDIKRYQIVTSLIILSNLPVAYVILMLGLSPVYIFVAKLIINGIAYFYRAYYVKNLISFETDIYIKNVIFPIFVISIALTVLGLTAYNIIENYIISSLLMFIISVTIVMYLGLSAKERTFVLQSIKSKLRIK